MNIITSFPKSGNTWMRFIIYELLYNDKNEDNNNSLNIKNKVPDLHLLLKIKNNQFVLDTDKIGDYRNIYLKTHFGYNQLKNFPLNKIIIIIRNPLDVFASLINYYDITNDKIDELVDFFSKNYTLPRFKNFPNWNEHLDSWINSNLKFCLFKYSDLLEDFDNQIVKLSNFLNIKTDNKKIQIIKKNKSFEKLKKIEIFERIKNLNSFFNNDAMGLVKNSFMNIGKNHYYSSILSPNQIAKLEKTFGKTIEKYQL